MTASVLPLTVMSGLKILKKSRLQSQQRADKKKQRERVMWSTLGFEATGFCDSRSVDSRSAGNETRSDPHHMHRGGRGGLGGGGLGGLGGAHASLCSCVQWGECITLINVVWIKSSEQFFPLHAVLESWRVSTAAAAKHHGNRETRSNQQTHVNSQLFSAPEKNRTTAKTKHHEGSVKKTLKETRIYKIKHKCAAKLKILLIFKQFTSNQNIKYPAFYCQLKFVYQVHKLDTCTVALKVKCTNISWPQKHFTKPRN